jgi:SAM-dependent methyltransferase
MIFPEPERFFQGAFRTLKPGGQLGFAVWKEVGWTELIPAIIKHIRPSDPAAHEPFRAFIHAWDKIEFVQSILERSGFVDINIEEMKASIEAPNMDMLKNGPLGPVSAEITKDWSEDEKAKWSKAVDLAANEVFGIKEDGSVSVPMVAWIVTAKKGDAQ